MIKKGSHWGEELLNISFTAHFMFDQLFYVCHTELYSPQQSKDIFAAKFNCEIYYSVAKL